MIIGGFVGLVACESLGKAARRVLYAWTGLVGVIGLLVAAQVTSLELNALYLGIISAWLFRSSKRPVFLVRTLNLSPDECSLRSLTSLLTDPNAQLWQQRRTGLRTFILTAKLRPITQSRDFPVK